MAKRYPLPEGVTLRRGDLVRRANWRDFHGSPVLKIQSITGLKDPTRKDVNINGKYFTDPNTLIKITEQEAADMQLIWNSFEIHPSRAKGNLEACVSSASGVSKNQLTPEAAKVSWFRMRMGRPSETFEAYNCQVCGNLHIGRVKKEEARPSLWQRIKKILGIK